MSVPVMTVSGENFSMDYVTFGSGPRALVILPGMSLLPVTPNADAVAAAYASFAGTHTVYLFDRKRDVCPGYTVSDMADDTAAAMRALGISDADVFGASQGGMIAQLIAARRPELVRRLVLGSSAAFMCPRAAAVMQRWHDLAVAGDRRELNRDVFRRVYSDAYRTAYRDAFHALEDLGGPDDLARFAILASACLSFDSRASLPAVRCPVFVIGSRNDETLFPESSEYLAEALGAPLYLYDGYSHAVYDEAPDYREHLSGFFSADQEK